jgi:hypothetical protein
VNTILVALLQAMEGHILAGGELSGEYINKKIFK